MFELAFFQAYIEVTGGLYTLLHLSLKTLKLLSFTTSSTFTSVCISRRFVCAFRSSFTMDRLSGFWWRFSRKLLTFSDVTLMHLLMAVPLCLWDSSRSSYNCLHWLAELTSFSNVAVGILVFKAWMIRSSISRNFLIDSWNSRNSSHVIAMPHVQHIFALLFKKKWS